MRENGRDRSRARSKFANAILGKKKGEIISIKSNVFITFSSQKKSIVGGGKETVFL